MQQHATRPARHGGRQRKRRAGAGPGPGSSASGIPGATTLGPSVDKSATLSGDIEMPATATGSPVMFDSKALMGPGDWGGIVVQSGGDAKLTQLAMHRATVAFQADPGSTYTIDYILVDTSSTIAELDADGTLGHGQRHGNGAKQVGDPIFITSASPKISDTLVDNSNSGTDQINVSGLGSAPQFDHMEVTGCHCAFHFNQGKNIIISNSYVHDSAYGMMILGAVNTQVTNSNFEKNTVNIGDCFGAGNVVATGNYYDTAAFDMSCSGQTNNSPSASKLANVGPRP